MKYLAFMQMVKVPFDNNLANEDIMLKGSTERNIGLLSGNCAWCSSFAIRSYLSTMRKQNSVWSALVFVFGDILMPGSPV